MAVYATSKKYPIFLTTLLIWLILIVWLSTPLTVQAHEDETTSPKMLVLPSINFSFIWTGFIQKGIVATLTETTLDVELYAEYISIKWYDPQLHSPQFINTYQTKYKNMEMISIIRRHR